VNIVAILILGGIGGIFRFSLESLGVYGTLMVNLIGCLALGFFGGIATGRSIPGWIQNGVNTGLIASFTTFASFTNAVQHLMVFRLSLGVLYIILSVGGGTVLGYVGERVAKQFKSTSHEYPNHNQQQPRTNRSTHAQLSWYKSHIEPDRD